MWREGFTTSFNFVHPVGTVNTCSRCFPQAPRPAKSESCAAHSNADDLMMCVLDEGVKSCSLLESAKVALLRLYGANMMPLLLAFCRERRQDS